MSGLCLTAGALLAAIPVSQFSLVKVDNVDGSRQETVWRVAGKQLQPVPEAGKTPPRSVPRLMISHAPNAPAHELCLDGRCRPLPGLLPGIGASALIEIAPCPAP